TVLTHELGHVLGLSHDDDAWFPVMAERLDPGTRTGTTSGPVQARVDVLGLGTWMPAVWSSAAPYARVPGGAATPPSARLGVPAGFVLGLGQARGALDLQLGTGVHVRGAGLGGGVPGVRAKGAGEPPALRGWLLGDVGRRVQRLAAAAGRVEPAEVD